MKIALDMIYQSNCCEDSFRDDVSKCCEDSFGDDASIQNVVKIALEMMYQYKML